MFNKNNRYMTRGIKETLDISLQMMLWKMVDDLKESKEIELDYLQVFKIRRSSKELIIEHTQEVPEYKKIYTFNKLSSLVEEDLKIFIIDENDYNIMLLAEEYWLKSMINEDCNNLRNRRRKSWI